MSDRNQLDEILDRALGRYCDAEPREGLDGRILERVRAAKRSAATGWIWAVACAAVLAIVASLYVPTNGKTPKPFEPAVAPLVTATPPVRWSFDVHYHPIRRRTARRELPKLPDFPSRTPLTAEERALLQFVSESPKEAVKLLSDWQQKAAQPIQIEPIQIVPLESGDSNTKDAEGKGAEN